MKALHVPDVRDANPYQSLLAQGLESRGVDVAFASSHLTPVTRLLPPNRRPDVLHLHWAHPFLRAATRTAARLRGRLVPAVLRLARRFDVPLVWTVHNVQDHEASHPDLARAARARLARAADALLVHCPDARTRLVDAWDLPDAVRDRVRVAPHPPYPAPGDDAPTRDEARQALDLPAEGPVVAHVGKLRPYKGSLDLVAAFGRLDRPEARLVVAGDPETQTLARDLREAAQDDDRIRLDLRRLPEADLGRILAAADLVALPYRRILTSGTLHLALAHDRPVLAPRLGCLPWDLPDGAGHLYDPDADLGEVLSEALTRDRLAGLTEGARKASGPSLDEAVEPVLAAYEDAVSR